jgi:predicted esterase
MTSNSLHQGTRVLERGAPLAKSEGAIILLHGRGGSAADILDLGDSLNVNSASLLAPQAVGNTWYPQSFMAPIEQNEPWLSSAILLVESLVARCLEAGMSSSQIVVAGFSQGACLATEFVARHPRSYRALLAFTGGLIGPEGISLLHGGSLVGTTALLSSGDPDPHVPWSRVEASADSLRAMGASVQLKRYPSRPHTITNEEVLEARRLLSKLST